MLDGEALEAVIREENPDYIIPEIEAIATDRLVKLEEEGFNVIPTAKATRLTMNREGIRRLAAEELGIPTSPYRFAQTREEFDAAVAEIGIPCVVKPVMSSSGHGQSTIRSEADIDNAWKVSQEGGRAGSGKVIVEGFVNFDYEITLLTVRHSAGTTFLKPIGHHQVDGPVQPHSAPTPPYPSVPAATPTPAPVEAELKVSVDGEKSKPWRWFKFLAQPESGYLLIETDAGIVTINPVAARERIVYERLKDVKTPSQPLLIPETVRLSPVDYSRLAAAMDVLTATGFALEPFGQNTFKIDAIPQIASSLSAADLLATISRDLSEPGQRRGGERWREELIAKSVARSFAGAPIRFTPEAATKLVEELCSCRMPYVCPRGKPVMIFTSTRELDRKFDRA